MKKLRRNHVLNCDPLGVHGPLSRKAFFIEGKARSVFSLLIGSCETILFSQRALAKSTCAFLLKMATAAAVMEANLPTRVYQATVLRPVVVVALSAQHPPFDLQQLVERRVVRAREIKSPVGDLFFVAPRHRRQFHDDDGVVRAQANNSGGGGAEAVCQVACGRIDVCLTQPMYPHRLALTVQSVAIPSAVLSQSCYAETRLQVQVTPSTCLSFVVSKCQCLVDEAALLCVASPASFS